MGVGASSAAVATPCVGGWRHGVLVRKRLVVSLSVQAKKDTKGSKKSVLYSFVIGYFIQSIGIMVFKKSHYELQFAVIKRECVFFYVTIHLFKNMTNP